MTTEEHLVRLRNGQPMTLSEKLNLVARLSLPSMMAQVSTIVMEYIDSGMVGHLGRDATASIGLVMTSLWLVGGLCTSFISGFTIQTALAIGGKDNRRARSLTFQSFFLVMAIALVICGVGALVHRSLPIWLGGRPSLVKDPDLLPVYAGDGAPSALQQPADRQWQYEDTGNLKYHRLFSGCDL